MKHSRQYYCMKHARTDHKNIPIYLMEQSCHNSNSSVHLKKYAEIFKIKTIEEERLISTELIDLWRKNNRRFRSSGR